MDKIDEALVAALQANGRESYSSLACRLHLSQSTVRRRVRRLFQEGFLRVVTVVDPSKMGAECCALIGLDVDLAHIDSVIEALAKEDNVRFAASATGRFDAFVVVDCRSQKELGGFISERLAAIEGIRQTETFLLLKIRKALHRLDLWGES